MRKYDIFFKLRRIWIGFYAAFFWGNHGYLLYIISDENTLKSIERNIVIFQTMILNAILIRF